MSLTLGKEWPNKKIKVKVVGIDDGNPDPVLVTKTVKTDKSGNFGFIIPNTIDRYNVYVTVNINKCACITIKSEELIGVE